MNTMAAGIAATGIAGIKSALQNDYGEEEEEGKKIMFNIIFRRRRGSYLFAQFFRKEGY